MLCSLSHSHSRVSCAALARLPRLRVIYALSRWLCWELCTALRRTAALSPWSNYELLIASLSYRLPAWSSVLWISTLEMSAWFRSRSVRAEEAKTFGLNGKSGNISFVKMYSTDRRRRAESIKYIQPCSSVCLSVFQYEWTHRLESFSELKTISLLSSGTRRSNSLQ